MAFLIGDKVLLISFTFDEKQGDLAHELLRHFDNNLIRRLATGGAAYSWLN